jgi:hypothetical protein
LFQQGNQFTHAQLSALQIEQDVHHLLPGP